MSIWTEVKGVAYLHKDKHISLAKLIEKHFYEHEAIPIINR